MASLSPYLPCQFQPLLFHFQLFTFFFENAKQIKNNSLLFIYNRNKYHLFLLIKAINLYLTSIKIRKQRQRRKDRQNARKASYQGSPSTLFPRLLIHKHREDLDDAQFQYPNRLFLIFNQYSLNQFFCRNDFNHFKDNCTIYTQNNKFKHFKTFLSFCFPTNQPITRSSTLLLLFFQSSCTFPTHALNHLSNFPHNTTHYCNSQLQILLFFHFCKFLYTHYHSAKNTILLRAFRCLSNPLYKFRHCRFALLHIHSAYHQQNPLRICNLFALILLFLVFCYSRTLHCIVNRHYTQLHPFHLVDYASIVLHKYILNYQCIGHTHQLHYFLYLLSSSFRLSLSFFPSLRNFHLQTLLINSLRFSKELIQLHSAYHYSFRLHSQHSNFKQTHAQIGQQGQIFLSVRSLVIILALIQYCLISWIVAF